MNTNTYSSLLFFGIRSLSKKTGILERSDVWNIDFLMYYVSYYIFFFP